MSNIQRISELSDFHKDAYGFRPSPSQWAHWAQMNDIELAAEEADLHEAIAYSIKQDEAREAAAVVEFEAYIAKMQSDYNIDRATAIRWDKESIGDEIAMYGDEMYCHHHGLPYGYFKSAIAA